MINLIMMVMIFVLSYALVPEIIKSWNQRSVCINWQTLILNTICCFVLTGCFIHLRMYLQSLAELLASLAWLLLLIMKDAERIIRAAQRKDLTSTDL